MKTRSKTLFILTFMSMWLTFAQNKINYKPKSLVKELEKVGITDWSNITEMSIPASIQKDNPIQGTYFLIKNTKEAPYQYIYVGRVNSCRAGGCSIGNETPEDVTSEYFDYFILFDKNKTVKMVKVYNYQATHGQEITAKGWLKQFIGYDGTESLEVNKNVDGISGATISVYAITIDVELKTGILKHL